MLRSERLRFGPAAAAALVAAVAAAVVTGVAVDRSADERTRSILERGDSVANGSPDRPFAVGPGYLWDLTAALGDEPCSERPMRILAHTLPDGWSVTPVRNGTIDLMPPDAPGLTVWCDRDPRRADPARPSGS